jgi:hypothetical protein
MEMYSKKTLHDPPTQIKKIRRQTNKPCYICHFCFRFTTPLKSDMKRHLNKTNRCSIQLIYESDEEAIYKTCENRYIFDMDMNLVTPEDFMSIVHIYTDSVNVVRENYKEEIRMFQEQVQQKYVESVSQSHPHPIMDDDASCDQSARSAKTDDSSFGVANTVGSIQTQLKFCSITGGIAERLRARIDEDYHSESDNDSGSNEVRVVHVKKKELKCGYCDTVFLSRQGLSKHIERRSIDSRKCDKRRIQNEHVEHVYNKKFIKDESEPTIIQNIHNGDVHNTINQNTQNTVNNNNNFKINLPVRDFMHDIYDHTHIDYRELSTDFFILKNFLKLLLENKSNQNIFFVEDCEKQAIVYTRDDVRTITSEKAGFILLEKLYKTIGNLIDNVVTDEEKRNKFVYMRKYYKILMDKYRCDTTYREYDPETHKFFSTSHGNQLRSRDEYLADMMKVINSFESSVRDTIFQNESLQITPSKYLSINPNIEDFASTRVRYRDLRV